MLLHTERTEDDSIVVPFAVVEILLPLVQVS